MKTGDRVTMSDKGNKSFRKLKNMHISRNGTVISMGRTSKMMLVLRDGIKNPVSYHIDFWELQK